MLGALAAVGVALVVWLRTKKDGPGPVSDSVTTTLRASPQWTQDRERFFGEIWPFAKTNVFDKLEALAPLGVVNPLASNREPKLTKIKFAGQEGSTVCVAMLNNTIKIGYHDLVRPGNLKLRGVDSLTEIGTDENGVPYDDDHIRGRLNDPRVPPSIKEQLIKTLADTNLYPRLTHARAAEIAQRILDSFEERPDLYALNRQRPFYSKANGILSPNYVFIYDRIRQKPTENLAEKDSIFVILRSSKDGVHLQHYDSSYHDFLADRAVHGR